MLDHLHGAIRIEQRHQFGNVGPHEHVRGVEEDGAALVVAQVRHEEARIDKRVRPIPLLASERDDL